MLISVITLLSAVLCVVIPGEFGAHWLWAVPLTFAVSFLMLAGVSFAALWLMCQRIDTDTPRTKDSPFWRKMAEIYIDAVVRLLGVRIHAQGTEKCPRQGRFLLVCNHLYDVDPGVLLHVFPRCQLAFISKKENRSLPIVGKVMHALLCQCIDRENDRAALKTILECIRIIREDEASIAVFPEGGTNHDNHLHPFRPGVFKIAQKAKVPIVVCTIEGTREIFHNVKHLKPSHIHVNLVEVIPPEEFEGMKTVEISDRVWTLMKNSLGPGYQPMD